MARLLHSIDTWDRFCMAVVQSGKVFFPVGWRDERNDSGKTRLRAGFSIFTIDTCGRLRQRVKQGYTT